MATTTKPKTTTPPVKATTPPEPPVEQEAEAAVAEVEHILAGDPPPPSFGRLKCHRCGARFNAGGHCHQPGNGIREQYLCPECAYLLHVCLRHTGHAMAAAIEILNVEGIGQLNP